MDIINDAAAKQTLVGSSKRRLPSSCAADYLGAPSIEKDLKRKRRRTAPATGIPVIAQKDSKGVAAKLAQHRQIHEYQFEIQKPKERRPRVPDQTRQVTEISDLYTASSAYNITTASPIAPAPLPSSSSAAAIFTGGAPDPGLPAFIPEQSSVSTQATVSLGTGIALHSPLPSETNRVEDQERNLSDHIDFISPDTGSWIPLTEALPPTVYSSNVFGTLQSPSSDLDLSRHLAFSSPNYQLQSPHRPISQQSVDILRYPYYVWQPTPWALHQQNPILGQPSSGPQVNMAITQNPLRVAAPAPHALEIHLHHDNSVKEQENLDEQSDADYVVVGSVDSTPSGSLKDVSHLGEKEELADPAKIHSSGRSTDFNTSPQLSSWDMVIPVRDLDEGNLSNDESCDTCHDHTTSSHIIKVAVSPTANESSVGSSKAPKRRQTFNEIDRQETSRTRNLGACIRCKMQRIRCKENPGNPDGPCKTCAMVSKTSKKVIHHIDCLRWKLQEITLFRTSGLGLTKRWDGVMIRDVDFGDVQLDIRAIQMEQGLCDEPISFKVRRFKPQPGDVLFRKWYDKDVNVYKMVELAPYALADIHDTKEIFVKYIDKHALECLKGFVSNTNNDVLGLAEDVVRDTYAMACAHLQSLGDDDQHADEKLLLTNLFRFWFALRHTTGSSWIAGEERLDMTPVSDPSYPAVLQGKISTPRMIIAQFDSINTQYVLRILSKRILEKLEKFMKTKNTNRYLTIFVSCFILLHEISHMTEDRYRHGRANGVEGGYSLPFFVRDLQFGANVILAHWHYYNSGLDPLTMDWDQRHKTPLADLSEKEIMYLITTWQRMKDREEDIRNMWEHGLHFHSIYFVAQMFEPKWSLKKTFPG